MFEWVDKHKRWIQIGLLILIVPSFAFFGINYYFNEYGDSGAVAKVAGSKITPNEFEQALRERQDQLRQTMKEKADPALLDSSEVRNSVINGLVERRALLAHALHAGLTVPDEQVSRSIVSVPYFQDEATGKFSREKYEKILRAQGMTHAIFSERIRQDMRVSQVRDTVSGSAVVADTVVGRLGSIREQQREISQWTLSPDQMFSRVTASDEEVRSFYETRKNEFRIPERVRVEYVALTAEDVGKAIQVPDAEVRKFYEDNQSQFGKPEERRASHILITVPKAATPEVKAAARKQAEQIVDQVRKAPATFPEVARKQSQDPGSAAKGGDLGFNPRGVMVKAFDDAMFGLKVGEVAGPVETEFGFHVIRLEAVKPAETAPLEKVRAEIEAELRKPRLGKAFADAAENLQNLVYEQSDSLKPASEALKLPIKTSDWLTRAGSGEPQFLLKPQMLSKIFSDDALKQKRNTDAVEVESNLVVAARVVEHREGSFLSLDDVKASIKQQIQIEKAGKLVEQDGKAALERVRKGDEKGIAWSAPVLVSLGRPGPVQAEVARDVFSADAAKLPAYVGTTLPGGRFVIIRIGKVIEAPPVQGDDRKALARQVAQLAAQQQLDAYVQTVKAGAGVTIDSAKIEKKPQQP